jgi:hypothetical protein
MMNSKPRALSLLLFVIAVLGVLGFKAVHQGWFVAQPQLELNSQPALLFFTLSEGCNCQMVIIRRAATQIAFWELPEHLAINIIRIDFSLQPDLARYYDVARAPALVLLDAQGQAVWKQDVGLSDEKPLDLIQAQSQIEGLLLSETE